MTTLTEAESAIIGRCIMGTGRAGALEITPNGALGEAITYIDRTDPDKHLLDCATLIFCYRKSGLIVSKFTGNSTDQASDETLRPAPDRVADLLRQALDPAYRSALPEALNLLKHNNLRLPFSLLPNMLTAACKDRELIADLLPVLGNRGLWLSSQNAAWRPVFREAQIAKLLSQESSDDELAKLWPTQDKAGRTTIVKALRKQNPTFALDLIESTWLADSAADRVAQLSEMLTGLSHADEPFLVKALDDKSKDVNKIACRLLSYLPGSELTNAAIEFCRSHLIFKKNSLGSELAVVVPAAYDPTWFRYDIDQTSTVQNIGDRSWWFVQWLSLVPPEYWTKEFQLTPDKLLVLASTTDWRDALWIGWLKAFSISKDLDWKYAILRKFAFMDERRISISGQTPSIDDLGNRAEHLLFELLDSEKEPLHDMHRALKYLSIYTKPWSPELTRRVMRSIYQRIELPIDVSRHTYMTSHLLKSMSHRINPAMAPELAYDWPETSAACPTWRSHILSFEAILSFRHELYKELTR